MRILVVSSYPPRHCGIGAYARDQVSRMRADGHDVTVLSPPDGDGDLKVPFFGGRPFVRAARIAGRFDRIIVNFQPALYFRPRVPLSKVLTSAGLLWLVLRRPGTEVLVHEADVPALWRPDYALLRLAFTRAHLLFHTEAERAQLERAYGIEARATLIEHLVAAVAAVPPDGARARAELGLSDAPRPILVCAGFVQPSKGFDRAVRAFARSDSEGSMFVVGSVREPTPENEAHAATLRSLCEATEGATFDERFLTDEDFDRWVMAADRLVLPYRVSWSSGVLARAHALGTPSIVMDVGGLAQQAGPQDTMVRSDDDLEAALRLVASERSADRAGSGRQ
jgi:glycosyltransferase involved in cell wall biosynthesis